VGPLKRSWEVLRDDLRYLHLVQNINLKTVLGLAEIYATGATIGFSAR